MCIFSARKEIRLVSVRILADFIFFFNFVFEKNTYFFFTGYAANQSADQTNDVG